MKRLRSLATGGLEAVPPADFEALAEECRVKAIESGDSRFAVLERLLQGLGDWWDVKGAIPTPLANEIDILLRQGLGDVLDAVEPADGAALAQHLLYSVEQRELADGEWFRRGYVRTHSDS